MTFEEACDMANVKPEDFLFDGKMNTMRYVCVANEAFGIVTAENLCDTCVHYDVCPYKSTYSEKYVECNFYEK